MKKSIQLGFVLSLASVAFAGTKLSPDLQAGNGNMSPGAMPGSMSPGVSGVAGVISSAQVDVIVQFKTPPTKDELKLLGSYGQTKKTFNTIHAIHAIVSSSVFASLEADPNVRYVSPNRQNKKLLDITTAAVGANFAWQSGWDGTGVGIAVIDSGIALKHDLTGHDGVTSRVIYSENFATGQNDASDGYGHGTHVAGIAGSGGRDSNGVGFTRTFKGVAPNANLINLRVLDQNGVGYESDVIAAIEQAINLKNTYNIRVINLSLGRQVFESYTLDPLCQAAEAAWAAGIVVVTAAGNYGRDNTLNTNGYGTIASPGNDPYVITVGAMNTHGTTWTSDDTIASYSSKGPSLIDHIVKPDLVAPGNQIVSLRAPNSTLAAVLPQDVVPYSFYETGVSGTSPNYFRLSGTSMATPVVSGAAALLIQQHPYLTPDQVKAKLMKTATKTLNIYSTATDAFTFQRFNNQTDIFTVGAGYLNVQAALMNNDLATLPALSPTAVYNSSTRTFSITRNLNTAWGTSVLWGDGIVWGNVVFKIVGVTGLDDSILWGDSVCWGDSTTSGFSAIWGSSVNATASLQALSDGDDDQ